MTGFVTLLEFSIFILTKIILNMKQGIFGGCALSEKEKILDYYFCVLF